MCLPGGCAYQGGVPTRGVYLSGGVPARGGACRGGSVPAQGGCVPARGGLLLGGVPAGGCLPPVNRMTDRCKNITLATTSLRPVKTLYYQMYIMLLDRFRGIVLSVTLQ